MLLFNLFAFESGDNPGPQPGMAAKFADIFPMVLMIIALIFSVFLRFPPRKGENVSSERQESEVS